MAAVSRECVSLSHDILKTLVEVKSAGTAKAFFKAMKDKRTIEKLQHRLEERNAALDSAILIDLYGRSELMAVQQRDRSTVVGEKVEKLLETLRNLRADQEKRLSQLTAASTRTHNAVDMVGRQVVVEASNIKTAITRHSKLGETRRQRELFLQSLAFDGISQRHESIAPPSDLTFAWVFACERTGDVQCNARKQASDTYLRWLRSDSIYWVNGKAGSGKSTLMSYLVEHQETRAGLEAWAGQHQLCLLSFFFWRAGSNLQRNTTGLLRTILHQLLSSNADLCDNVRSFSSMPPNSTWTEAALCRSLEHAFQNLPDARICMLLDGLDEFEGDCNALLELLLTLQKLGTIKMCLSSRPGPALVARLSGFPGMCLSTLNSEDIKLFAAERLAACDIPLTRFVGEISTRAEGVFLWALLVTRSLVDGSQAGHSIADLAKRLFFCPR